MQNDGWKKEVYALWVLGRASTAVSVHLLLSAREIASPLSNPVHVAVLEQREVGLEGARVANLWLHSASHFTNESVA